MDASGVVRVWQVESMELYKAAQTWKQMVGVDQKVLSVIYETDKVCMMQISKSAAFLTNERYIMLYAISLRMKTCKEINKLSVKQQLLVKVTAKAKEMVKVKVKDQDKDLEVVKDLAMVLQVVPKAKDQVEEEQALEPI